MRRRSFYTFFLLLILISIVFIYLLIPSPLRISREFITKGFDENVFAVLSDSNQWNKLSYDSRASGYSFFIAKSIYPRIFINARNSVTTIPIEIEILDNIKTDSSIITWHCELPAGYTPWGRLKSYINARRLKEIISEKIKLVSEYAGNTEHIYGLPISESKVKDTIVATLTRHVLKPPSNLLICALINTLRHQIKLSDLLITDSAMILIPTRTDGKYIVMVGFPVNKTPASSSSVIIKNMIPGKLLTGIVSGGYSTINNAYQQMKKYITDRGIEEAALPYEVFVTNRCLEKDTTKWISKICYPIF